MATNRLVIVSGPSGVGKRPTIDLPRQSMPWQKIPIIEPRAHELAKIYELKG